MSVLQWLLGLPFLVQIAWAGPVQDAEALLRAERPGAALQLLQAHVTSTTDDVEAHELLIDIQINAGLIDAVRQSYEDRARTRPADADAWYLLGRASMDLGASELAYRKAIELEPDHARAMTGRAALLRATGQPIEAAQLYTQALTLDRTLLEAWTGLWNCQLQQDDHLSAAMTAEQASAAIPGAPEPWLTLALLRPDQARRYLAEGLKSSPEDYRLMIDYARQLFREQDLAAAQAAYVEALPIIQDDPTVRTESALLFEIGSGSLSWEGAQLLMDVRSQENSPETLRQVDNIVMQHPRSSLARVIRGNLHQMQSDPTAAEADLRAAVELSPQSPEANAALGLVLLSQRRPTEAIDPLQIASAQRPTDVVLGMTLAVALTEGQDPGAGGLLLMELSERFPYNAGPPMALAQLLMNLGEPDQAYQILSEATRRIPEQQLVLAMAATARAAGRPAEAAAAMRTLGEQTGDPRFEQAARQLLEEGLE